MDILWLYGWVSHPKYGLKRPISEKNLAIDFQFKVIIKYELIIHNRTRTDEYKKNLI